MITKKVLKSKPVCKVTFALSKEEAGHAGKVHLVGDFNEWNHQAHPLKKLKNGNYKITVDLTQGKSYQFRYLIDGREWINDSDADKYVHSGVGAAENGVVSL